MLPYLIPNIFVLSHVLNCSNPLPIGQHYCVPATAMSHRKLNFMKETKEVGIHKKSKAVIVVVNDLANYDVSTLSLSMRLIGNAEHDKGYSGSSLDIVKNDSRLVSDDCYNEG